jgi:manganese/zinc/iron transport system permease protein
MVLAASTVFGGAFFFGPRHGFLARLWRQRSRSARTRRENTLKAMFHVQETGGAHGEGVGLAELADRRKEGDAAARRQGEELVRHGLATLDGDVLHFTPAGRRRAGEIVRNHRLWELYLTNSANIAPDHVHEDAEKIEHVLGEQVVRDLERRLNYAKVDPHGKAIPGPREIHRDEEGGTRT